MNKQGNTATAETGDGAVFAQHRGMLFGIAYRMVGSVSDAEDIVQEAWLRWQGRPEAGVQSPKAYLSAVVTRLSIDHLRAARTRRETYVGPWLPEPLVSEHAPDVAETVVLHESLSMAFLTLLETLTPEERASFLLHDVFGYEFREVAAIIGKEEANCRQLARRARLHALAGRPRFVPSRDEQERLTRAFLQAMVAGDMSALMELFTDDIVMETDGGGVVRAALNPIRGPRNVAKLIVSGMAQAPPNTAFRVMTVNGEIGVISEAEGRVYGVVAVEWAGERIRRLRAVTNPEKLRGVAPVRPPDDAARSPREEDAHGTDTTA